MNQELLMQSCITWFIEKESIGSQIQLLIFSHHQTIRIIILVLGDDAGMAQQKEWSSRGEHRNKTATVIEWKFTNFFRKHEQVFLPKCRNHINKLKEYMIVQINKLKEYMIVQINKLTPSNTPKGNWDLISDHAKKQEHHACKFVTLLFNLECNKIKLCYFLSTDYQKIACLSRPQNADCDSCWMRCEL